MRRVDAALAEVAVERAVVAVAVEAACAGRAGSRRAARAAPPSPPSPPRCPARPGTRAVAPRPDSRTFQIVLLLVAGRRTASSTARAGACCSASISALRLRVGLVLACRRRTRPAASRCPSGSSSTSRGWMPLPRHVVDEPVVDPLEADRARTARTSRHVVGRPRRRPGSRAPAASAPAGSCTRRSVASSTVTQVPSVPTSARATLKPFSGSSCGEVVARDAARDVREARRGSRRRSGRAASRSSRVDLAAPAAGRDDRARARRRASARPRSRSAVVGEDLQLLDVVARSCRAITECTPQELLPIIPPSVQWLWVDGIGRRR